MFILRIPNEYCIAILAAQWQHGLFSQIFSFFLFGFQMFYLKVIVYVLHPHIHHSIQFEQVSVSNPSHCGLWSCFFFFFRLYFFEPKNSFLLFVFWSCSNNIHYFTIFPFCFVFISHRIDSKQRILYERKCIQKKLFDKMAIEWHENDVDDPIHHYSPVFNDDRFLGIQIQFSFKTKEEIWWLWENFN